MPAQPMRDQPTAPEATARLRTADGEVIFARYEPGPVTGPSAERVTPVPGVCFVLAHGFTGAVWRQRTRALVEIFRRHGAVLTFDFRGHGRSTGHTTVGGREINDLDAAVRWARDLGHLRVVTIGFSMGAAVVIRHSALLGREAAPGRVDAVVAVSGPSRWQYHGSRAMRTLKFGCQSAVGRLVLRSFYDTRVAKEDWYPSPEPPDAVIGRITEPVLILHGDRDRYFPPEHAEWLHSVATPPCDLWIEPGMGHAEQAVPPSLAQRVMAWVGDALAAHAPLAAPVPAPEANPTVSHSGTTNPTVRHRGIPGMGPADTLGEAAAAAAAALASFREKAQAAGERAQAALTEGAWSVESLGDPGPVT